MDNYQSKLSFDFKTNQLIIKKISFIDSFKSKWKILERKSFPYLQDLQKQTIIESVGASTRIEGTRMDNDEIALLLSNIKKSKLTTIDQQEVVGYYEVLTFIESEYLNISLNDTSIKQMHSLLLKYCPSESKHRGSFKKYSNKIVSKYPDGTQKIIFNSTEPALVDKEIYELLKWTNQHLEKKEIHPLVIISLFIYEFLSIHPFQDGNGRMSRLLTTLLLLKSKYKYISYASLEGQIEQKKKLYYEALMDGQRFRYLDTERIGTWVLFFLSSMETLIQKLEKEFELKTPKAGYLNDRQKKIKAFIQKNQPVKLNDLVLAITDTTVHTIKKDLQYLKSENLIESEGKNRGTIYIISAN
jgi:Fic family protein